MMVDGKIPECIECQSTEVVVHEHDVAAFGDTARPTVASYECLECGLQWQPSHRAVRSRSTAAPPLFLTR